MAALRLEINDNRRIRSKPNLDPAARIPTASIFCNREPGTVSRLPLSGRLAFTNVARDCVDSQRVESRTSLLAIVNDVVSATIEDFWGTLDEAQKQRKVSG